MEKLTAVSAAIYAARTLSYIDGLSIQDAVLKNDNGEFAEVAWTDVTGFKGSMTVWIEDGKHYGEW